MRLEGLVGLGTVKQRVIELVEYAARKRGRDPEHMPALHLCMLGPAGTGKTTVARLVGEMLGEAGVLEHPSASSRSTGPSWSRGTCVRGPSASAEPLPSGVGRRVAA